MLSYYSQDSITEFISLSINSVNVSGIIVISNKKQSKLIFIIYKTGDRSGLNDERVIRRNCSAE